MCFQVVAPSISNTPELSKAKGIVELQIASGKRVMGEFIFLMLSRADLFCLESTRLHTKFSRFIDPVLMPASTIFARAKPLQLELLKFSGPKNEVSWGHFVT